MPKDKVEFTYRFIFNDGRERSYPVVLDPQTGRFANAPVVAQNGEPLPEWVDLDFQKCRHCPLSREQSPQCPVALNLSVVLETFKAEKSFEKVTVEVLSPQRTYRKDVALQEGLFGLVGLIMATSDCPHMIFLRPMAQFHLPFSSLRETMTRSVSFYLFRQYFVALRGGKPDYDLKEYAMLYKKIEDVNLGIVGRIRAVARADAEANSLIILDGLAKLLSIGLTTNFRDLESIFSPDTISS